MLSMKFIVSIVSIWITRIFIFVHFYLYVKYLSFPIKIGPMIIDLDSYHTASGSYYEDGDFDYDAKE